MTIRMIVADDSATIQKVIKIALSQFDIEIVETRSFVEALSKLGSTPPDIIVADANLSGANSADDFCRLRVQADNAPLLLLMGSYETVNNDEFDQAGLTHRLKKPFESHEIVGKIDELLAGRLRAGEQTPKAAPPFEMPIVPPSDPRLPPPPVPPTRERAPIEEDAVVPVDQDRKGKRAFEESDEPEVDEDFVTTVPPTAPSPFEKPPERSFEIDQLSMTNPAADQAAAGKAASEIEPPEDWQDTVRAAVAAYCRDHFRDIAKEVITQELRRLAEERSRHLYDQ